MEVDAISRSEQVRARRVVTAGVALVLLVYAAWQGGLLESAAVAHGAAAEQAADHAPPPPPAGYSVLPFAALLLCIAILPLSGHTAHWWEKNFSKLLVSLALAGVALIYYGALYGQGVLDHGAHTLSEAGAPAVLATLKNAILIDYIPFIVLLFSLFVVSGGISVEGSLVGRPGLNTRILIIGSILASLVGTTGAAMLLIRPLLKFNARRKHVAHSVIFFIFVVCNTGGCLLPIGDPPLFLGYLRGVPFTWTLNLWPEWLFMNASLCAVYYVWDLYLYRREDLAVVEAPADVPEPVAVRGLVNFAWLAGVIAAAAFLNPDRVVPGTTWHAPVYFREMVMLALSVLSLWSTSADIRVRNSFNYDAILEVAILFVAIFICMQPPLQILDAYGAKLGIDRPWEFYWCTGALSSFLDNAPTYAVFFEIAKQVPPARGLVPTLQIGALELAAVSLGAVFMGAMTYIGNGPNFMVKTIAERSGVRMPSFFGYMLYSCAVLLPLSIALTLLFFH